jgi:hypothetical protein
VDPEGPFYNFYTLASENNVCPQGFHVPDNHDIAELYNYITPYGDHLKVSGSTVKKKVYSPALAPIAIPVLSAINLGWWTGASIIDASILSLTAAADVTLWSLQASAAVIDASLISPIFGWKSKKRQYKENLKKAQSYSYIDGNGKPYNKTQKGFVATNLKPINKSEWKNFTMIESFINDSSKTEYRPIEDLKKIDSLKNSHDDYKYSLRYNPFLLSGLYANNFIFITGNFIESDFFSKKKGLFGTFNVMPYRRINSKDYPSNKYQCSLDKVFDRQPVLTLLLNRGENEFADQYGFNLNFDNGASTVSGGKKTNSIYFSFKTGISYLNDFGYPAYFGIGGRNKYSYKAHELHELNLIGSGKNQKELTDLMRTGTRVRCVKD